MAKDIQGLERFIESAMSDNKLIHKAETTELKESINNCSNRLTESIEASAAEGWWVPISFYNKLNKNERNYNRKLWERVINEQRDIWQGAPMLVDHPADDSDGSPKDICGVWLDARMDEPNAEGFGLVYGLLMPSGRNGEDLKDHLKHGLKVGTSSSGFGKLLPDGVTVDPDTYLIERLSDWVLNPSQCTYFTYDESEDEPQVSETTANIHESTVKTTITEERKTMSNSKITKFEEKKFRKDMEAFLEDAEAFTDPRDRLREFKDIRSYLEEGVCPDLKERIEEKIAKEEAFIQTAIDEKLELKEKLNIDSPKDLELKLTKLVEEHAQMDKEAKDYKAISESLQEKVNELVAELDARPTQSIVQFHEARYKELNDKFTKLSTGTSVIIEKAKKLNKALLAKCNMQESTIKNLESEKKWLVENLDENKASMTESNKTLDSYKEAVTSLSAQKSQLLGKSASDKASFTEKVNKLNSDRVALANEIRKDRKTLAERDNMIASLRKQIAVLKENTKKQNKVIENSIKLKTATKTLQEQVKTLQSNNSKLARAVASQRAALETKTFVESKETADTVKSEDCFMESVAEVKNFYNGLFESYHTEIVPFREQILSCKTISDAKDTFFKKVLPLLG